MIKIYIEGESPLATLADLVATAHYFGGSPAVSAAARNVIAADEKSLGPMARRETSSVEVVNLGSQPRHHAPGPDSEGQHIFITQREENPSGNSMNANAAAPQPGNGTSRNPNQTAPAPGVVPNQNQAAPNGYPGNSAAQNPQSPRPQGAYPGNGNAQNPPPPNNGYGYPANPQNQPPVGAQGGAQGNPIMGEIGANPATMIPTSPSNPQQQYIPGMAPPAGNVPGPGAGQIPVSNAPGFTVAQVSKAGADLVTANPTKRGEVNALLQQYGVQTLNELKPNQLGPFAMALRGMGANI